MARTSLGNDTSLDISQGDVRLPLVSLGSSPVHIHPNLSLSNSSIEIVGVGSSATFDAFYTTGSTGFEIQIIAPVYILDGDGGYICDSSGDLIYGDLSAGTTSPFLSVSVGAEQNVGLSRVRREITVTYNSSDPGNLQDTTLRINFDNYMGQETITITQTAPPALTLASMTGGGVSGTATSDNTSSSNRNQITPSITAGTSVLTVSGEVGATYTLQENGDIITGLNKTQVHTIPSGGSNTHNITIAEAGDSERLGAIYALNTITNVREQIYFVQPADNVPVLTLSNQNLTDPIEGEAVTGTVSIATADAGDGSLAITEAGSLNTIVETITIAADGTGSYNYTLSGLDDGTHIFTFTFIDSGGRLGVTSLTVVVTPIGFSGSVASVDWNTTSQVLNWTVSGLTTAQRNRLNVNDFATHQQSPTSPSRGSAGSEGYTASTGVYSVTISSIPPFNSLGGSQSTTWQTSVTIGTKVTPQNSIITKSEREENNVTFPGGNPTILSTDTSVTFAVRYDSLTPNITLTDASSSDDDLWTDSELGNATMGVASNPNISSDVNNENFYLLQRDVTITGADVNVSVSTLMDMIRVTSSA